MQDVNRNNDVQTEILNIVQKFFKDNDVTCVETIHQTDKVIENAYDFIEDLYLALNKE